MKTALARCAPGRFLFPSLALLRQSPRSTNLVGALEHSAELLRGGGLPVVGNWREAPLFSFGLEGEPPLRPLLTERHAEFAILMHATVGSRTRLSTFTPTFRALGND